MARASIPPPSQDRTAGGLRACLALAIDRSAERKARAGGVLGGALSLGKGLDYYLIGKITTIYYTLSKCILPYVILTRSKYSSFSFPRTDEQVDVQRRKTANPEECCDSDLRLPDSQSCVFISDVTMPFHTETTGGF